MLGEPEHRHPHRERHQPRRRDPGGQRGHERPARLGREQGRGLLAVLRFQDAKARTRQDASRDATHHVLIVHEENDKLQKTLGLGSHGGWTLAKANVEGTSPNLPTATRSGRARIDRDGRRVAGHGMGTSRLLLCSHG